jgi:hypothetical protein
MIEDIELPKWTGLLVVGDSVTVEQAEEIIIRTSDWGYDLFNNDKSFLNNEIKNIYRESLPIEELISEVKLDEDIFYQKIDHLSLSYLDNDRIDSSWIGGLKGWCDWDGTIFCNNYNIGKYPNTIDVIDDLKDIVKAFPYLKFKLQLLSHEASIEEYIEEVKPLVSLEVSKGEIKELKIDYLIAPYMSQGEDESEEAFINILNRNWMKDSEHIERIIKTIKKLLLKSHS